jgi:hypothetical protein
MRQSFMRCALGIGLSVTVGPTLAGQQQPAVPVHVLKISSGPSGNQVNGTFVLTSERSIFNRTDDREVIVLFEWDGVPGPHRLIAQWRSPDSSVTSNSAVDYVAKAPRFGAYWSLPLSASMSVGTWSIEATVDGVPAGRLTFEVTDSRVASSPSKPMFTQAALYERLDQATVVLRRSSKAARALGATSGFRPAVGLIYTAMSTLDNADEIHMVSHDGSEHPVTMVNAWNRGQHWAALSGGADVGVQPIAVAAATSVGTRCFSLDSTPPTGRVLSECSITGQSTQGAGPSLIATFATGRGVPGAPVLNEFGELIGLVGDLGRTGETEVAYSPGGSTLGTPIVPVRLINVDATATPVTLLDLRSRGVTIPAVISDEHAMSGGFGRVDAKGRLTSTEHHDQLSMREKAFAVFVMWSPKERLRGQMIVRFFDPDNRVVAESKPAKVDLRKDQTSTSSWTLPMLTNPGTYRADVLLDNTPIWRGFLRIAN